MDILEAKLAVIEAGKKLVSCGLIARTWGNVSCRVNDTHFVITPSGREYNSLTPQEIVLVRIADCTYDGDVKPSSEKGIHAACYRLRPQCNFVIHTHQTYASLLGLAGMEVPVVCAQDAAVIGTVIPCAAYGLPGTGKLKKGVVGALRDSDAKAALMLHHGAVCLGDDIDDTFRIAETLERVCEQTLLAQYEKLSGKTADCFSAVSAYVAAAFTKKPSGRKEYPAYISERQGETIRMTPRDGGESVSIRLRDGAPVESELKYPQTAELHRAVYEKRGDVNCVIHSRQADVTAVSAIGKTVRPYLDDFAQIVGVTMRTADFNPADGRKTALKTVRKLKGRDAVLLRNNGALCVAATMPDAEAVGLVVEKGCRSYAAVRLFDKARTAIKPYECVLMRLIYKQKYSKQAKL